MGGCPFFSTRNLKKLQRTLRQENRVSVQRSFGLSINTLFGILQIIDGNVYVCYVLKNAGCVLLTQNLTFYR